MKKDDFYSFLTSKKQEWKIHSCLILIGFKKVLNLLFRLDREETITDDELITIVNEAEEDGTLKFYANKIKKISSIRTAQKKGNRFDESKVSFYIFICLL